MHLPQAIIFDLDGTILSLGDREADLVQVADEFAVALAPLCAAEVARRLEQKFAAYWSCPSGQAGRLALQNARKEIVAQTLSKLGAGPDPKRLADQFIERFAHIREQRIVPSPGALDTLAQLRARGVAMALVTNGAADQQRAKIERFSLAPLFQHIQVEGEVGFGKPEAKAYEHAMRALAAEPCNTWSVGDHLEWDVTAPQRLGVFAVWYDPAGQGLPRESRQRPDLTIRRLDELLGNLKRGGRAPQPPKPRPTSDGVDAP